MRWSVRPLVGVAGTALVSALLSFALPKRPLGRLRWGNHFMHQADSSEWRDIATTLGMNECDLERILPGLNALGKAFLAARHRDEDVWTRATTVSGLCAFGLTRADCRDLLDRGLAMADGRRGAARRVVIADAGLLVFQAAIPLGVIRPVYDRSSHKLSVAGQMILHPAVHGRNLSTILDSFEDVRWATRVEKPLAGRRCANDPRSLQVALSTLSNQQRIIEFHAQDGAATWNWRPERNIKRREP